MLGLSLEDKPNIDNILTGISPTSIIIRVVCSDLAVSNQIYPLL